MADQNPSRPRRVSTAIPATLIDVDGTRIPVVITDLSGAGFRIRTTETMVPGEKVTIRVPPAEDYPAEIQWAEHGEAGGRFLDPVRLVNGIPT